MRFALTALLAALFLSACAPTQPLDSAPVVAQEPWAFEGSDLPFDTEYKVGRLDNGMRYVIRRNATPAATGQIRFLVDAGSTAESESELGYAHFIEHMAFNGSKNIPEGEMIKLLEREGLAFGADTNASTSFDATLYMLDLPRNDPALLDTALMIMRETAGNLTIDPEAVEREKGVILSERRVRDTYALQNLVDRLGFFYPDAHFVRRMPIGTIETLQVTSAEALRAMYARLYTPDNSALVVVGDFDPAVVEQTIRKYFNDWSAPQSAPDPDNGPIDPALAGLTDIHLDPALSERVTAARNGPWLDEPDTIANRQKNLLRQVGYGIINRRFLRLANGENPPFIGAGFGSSEVFKVGRTTNLVIDTAEGGWRTGMIAAVSEYRRALEYGFTQSEVDEQLANIRTGLENAVASASTRYNSTHTSAALALLTDDFVPTTPETALARFEAFAPSITPEAALAGLKEEAVPLDNPLLRFEGRRDPEGGAEALRGAWNEAVSVVVAPIVEQTAGTFDYTDFGTPGVVVDSAMDDRLGIRTIRFANGLRVNLKPTDLRVDRISYELNVDGGDMLNTRDDPLATAMTNILPMGGLGKHTYDQLQSILAGKSVAFGINSSTETFRMAGSTTSRDLELQLELLAAGLTDPAYRTQAEERYRRSIADFFASHDATPGSAMGNALGGIISDGDPRFTLQPQNAYASKTFAELRETISDRLQNGAMELALVGDFDEQAAIALIARTLGALPPREENFRPYANNRHRSFTEDRSRRVVLHNGEPDQALLRFSWPTTDDSDVQQSMAFMLLERVLLIEMTDTLREELGQTYSPGVSSSLSRIYAGYGTLDISASLDVEDVDAAREAMIETLANLRTARIDDDIMLRARRPILESFDNLLKTNDGWMGLVDRAQTQSDRIDRYLGAHAMIEKVTAEDLRKLAQKYLDPDKRLEIIALPKKSAVVEQPVVVVPPASTAAP